LQHFDFSRHFWGVSFCQKSAARRLDATGATSDLTLLRQNVGASPWAPLRRGRGRGMIPKSCRPFGQDHGPKSIRWEHDAILLDRTVLWRRSADSACVSPVGFVSPNKIPVALNTSQARRGRAPSRPSTPYLPVCRKGDVDARDKRGHDESVIRPDRNMALKWLSQIAGMTKLARVRPRRVRNAITT
jgi:hypothetical protein